jgi:PHD/YefM family antitoxin component YafN of YafNO toxin-antitoxin module
MGKPAVLERARTIRIGKEPVVLVPLEAWREIEDLLEDREALRSKRYLRRVAKARRDIAAGKTVYPFR